MVIVMASTSSRNELHIYLKTLWYGKIERTWLQKPSPHKQSISLSLKGILIDGLLCPLNTGSNVSQFGFQTDKLWAFRIC